MKAAAINWKLREIRSDAKFFGHLVEFVEKAADAGAELIVLPELAVLELLFLEPSLPEVQVPEFLLKFEEPYEEALYGLAEKTGAVIVGGSHLIGESDGVRNACLSAYPTDQRFQTPDGGFSAGDYQRKVNLTVYEREIWGLEQGEGLQPLMDARIGVAVCYDAEFPESGRALAEAGVLVQCVPAWTETRRGFQRVRWSCQARAIENQNFVIHSSLTGSLGREPVTECHGSSAILCPSVEPFAESAILAETSYDEEGVAITDLDFAMLSEARSAGDVRNWEDRDKGNWGLIR